MDNFNGTNYMKNQFCSYEIAKQLKELEFDEECLCTYAKNDKRFMRNPGTNMLDEPIEDAPYYWQNSKVHESVICAPLWQQAISFLNDKLYTEHDKAAYSPEWLYYDGRSIKIIEQDILKVLELCQKEK